MRKNPNYAVITIREATEQDKGLPVKKLSDELEKLIAEGFAIVRN